MAYTPIPCAMPTASGRSRLRSTLDSQRQSARRLWKSSPRSSIPTARPSPPPRRRRPSNPLEQPIAKFNLPVASPKLWSVDRPTLYTVAHVLKRDGAAIDEVTTTCGFRTIRFDPDKGFFLNDQPIKLLGTCNHQDMAGVGIAVPDSLWDFRVRRLKEMGSNAYRCAHNPPAAEFLDACDRLGMLVMDENRNFGSSPEYLRQLQWMVRRDRNHPSVILWSVFNEEPSQGSEMGYEMVRRMAAAVKELDTTRPVTAAQSNCMLNPVNASQAADVAGFNYRRGDYDAYHAKPIPPSRSYSSEDTSAVMTRDEYVTDRKAAILDSYDDQLPGSWGLSHRKTWQKIDSRPFVAGGMVWTGFDYRGEPQPLPWPCRRLLLRLHGPLRFPQNRLLHSPGAVDQGQAHPPHCSRIGTGPAWRANPLRSWPSPTPTSVALSLNGKSLGENPVDKYEMLTVDVPYEARKTGSGRDPATAERSRASPSKPPANPPRSN